MTTDESQVAERTRRRFARRQWARRWLAWRYVLVGVLVLALVVGLVWLVFFSSFLSVKGVEVDGNEKLRDAQIERRRRRTRGRAAGHGRPRPDPHPGRGAGRRALRRRDPAVARPGADHASTSARRSRSSRSAASCGGWTRTAWSSAGLRPGAAPTCPACRPAPSTGSEALREGALVVAALPADLVAAVDHVEVETVDEISLVLRDGREVRVGERGRSPT